MNELSSGSIDDNVSHENRHCQHYCEYHVDDIPSQTQSYCLGILQLAMLDDAVLVVVDTELSSREPLGFIENVGEITESMMFPMK